MPSQHMDVNVTIFIVSDAHPRFEQQFTMFEVREDVELHTPIGTVEATSPNGHKLIYTITGGDTYHEFAVDFNMGMYILVILLILSTLVLILVSR